MIEFIQKTVSKNIRSPQKIIENMCAYLEQNLEFARLIVNNNMDRAFAQKVFSLEIIKDIIRQMAGNRSATELEYMYIFITSGAFGEVRSWLNKENRESPSELGKIIAIQMEMLSK